MLALGAGLSLGCAVNLDPDTPLLPRVRASNQLTGCMPAAEHVEKLEGRLGELTLADGRELLVASAASVDGLTMTTGLVLGNDETCLADAEPLPTRPLLDTSTLHTSAVGRPLAGLTTDTSYLFFAADRPDGFTNDGFGIARWDADAGRFVAVTLLWTADRPSYGSAAVVDGDYVYVFGGLAARFLAADAYLARAPLARITEPAAYEYWAGGGAYSPNADDAAPLVEAGTSPSVAWNAEHGRFILAYSSPLATDVTVRSGLGVSGPWSLPVTLGRCELPAIDADAFCGDVTLLPLLAQGGGITLAQSVGSFARAPGATPADYSTKLIRAAWPSALP